MCFEMDKIDKKKMIDGSGGSFCQILITTAKRLQDDDLVSVDFSAEDPIINMTKKMRTIDRKNSEENQTTIC